MATPTGPERRFLAVGAKKGATWGTAIALGAGAGVATKSISGLNRIMDLISAQEADAAMCKTSELDVVKPVDIGHICDMPYDPGALGTLIAQLMGIAGTPAAQGGGPAELHTLQLADSLSGIFSTFCAEFPGKIYEIHSAKPMSWNLKAADKGYMQSELKLRGDDVVDDSSVNQAAQMDALTYDDRQNRVLFRHATVRMNDQTAGTLEGTNGLNVNNIDIEIARTGFDEPRGLGATTILEPAEAGWPDIKVKLGFPRFDAASAAWFAKAKAYTYQKATITFVGALIAATYYYTIKFYFPQLRMKMPTNDWAEIVKTGLELQAEEAASNPTGMAHTRPYIEITNKRTTDYLG